MMKQNTSDGTAIAAASMLSAVGAAFFLILPLFLGALADQYSLTDRQIGLLGSAYLAGFSVLSTSAVLWINRWNWRRTTLVSLVVLIAFCLLLLTATQFPYLVAVVVAIGGAAGTVFAIATRVISGVQNPDRGFGIKLFAEQVCGAVLIFVIPLYLMPVWGLAGLVVGAILAFLILGTGAFGLPPSAGKAACQTVSDQAGSGGTVWFGLLGLTVFMFGLSAVWAFIERIANDAGLSAESIGAMLSVGLGFGAVGAALAAIIGDSLGHKWPQLLGMALLLVCLHLLSGELSVLRFGLAVILLSGMWNFLLAYQMASVARHDKGLQRTVLIAPAIAIGATFGPGVAGMLTVGTDYGPVYFLATVCLGITVVLFLFLEGFPVAGEKHA